MLPSTSVKDLSWELPGTSRYNIVMIHWCQYDMYCDVSIRYCDFIATQCSKHIAYPMSAAEGQDRAMRKYVLISHGNKSAENKLASCLKRK
jgi:hypothetical protein